MDLGAMTPFRGQLVRGIKGLTDDQLKLFMPDVCFYWPAFTSASVRMSTGENYSKNPHCGSQGRCVTFHIRCHRHDYGCDSEHVRYVPCSVQPHSINPGRPGCS